MPTPVPVNNFEQIPVFDSDPYHYGTPLPIGAGAAGLGGSLTMAAESEEAPAGHGWSRRLSPAGVEIPPEPPDVARPRAHRSPRACSRGATTFFFLAFLFAYFYLRSINQEHMWRRAREDSSHSPTGPRRGVDRLRAC